MSERKVLDLDDCKWQLNAARFEIGRLKKHNEMMHKVVREAWLDATGTEKAPPGLADRMRAAVAGPFEWDH